MSYAAKSTVAPPFRIRTKFYPNSRTPRNSFSGV